MKYLLKTANTKIMIEELHSDLISRQWDRNSFVFKILKITPLFSIVYVDFEEPNPLKTGRLPPDRGVGWVNSRPIS